MASTRLRTHSQGAHGHVAVLGRSVGKPLAHETGTGGEQKPYGSGQDPRSLFQLLDGDQELLAVMAERFEADDGAQTATLPLEMVERGMCTLWPSERAPVR